MTFEVIENTEDRTGKAIIRRKIYRTDAPQYPSGYRYALHYGFLDDQGVSLRDDNENQTPGRHERHTAEGIEEIEFPGMLELRDRFVNEIQDLP